MSTTPAGLLTKVLDYAGDMLAATGQWETLCGDDAENARDHIYIAAKPKAWDAEIHSPAALRAAAPFAIVHLDDEGPGAVFSYAATGAMFVAQHSIVMRIYLVPPDSIDEDDTNEVETWFLNQIGLIISNDDDEEGPGLLQLSHEPGNLLIRSLSFSGPMYPSEEQRAADHALIVSCELVLQTGVNT